MRPWKQIGRYGTVGLELVLSMAIGYGLGRWADGKMGTKFLALVGLLVGVYAGFRNLVRAAQFMQREAELADEEEARERAATEAAAERDRRFREHDREAGESASPPKAEPKSEAAEPKQTPKPGTVDVPVDLAQIPGVNARGTKRGDAPS